MAILDILHGRKQPFTIRETGESSINILEFDVAIREEHKFQNTVTQFPIENGATITDHIRKNPETITVEGFITNSPVPSLGKESITNYLKSVGKSSDKTLAAFSQLLYIGGYSAHKKTNIVDDFELEPVVVDIISGLRVYTGMAMQSLDVPRDRDSGNALRFTATFVQLRKVSVKKTAISRVVTKKAAAAGADTQAPLDADKGTQTPQVQDRSWLLNLISGIAGRQI